MTGGREDGRRETEDGSREESGPVMIGPSGRRAIEKQRELIRRFIDPLNQ